MPFTIPNSADAGFSAQAEPDSRDIEALVAGHARTGVVSGCAVTAQATPDMTVAVAAGTVEVAGTQAAVVAGNVTITAADSTNPRFDLIVASAVGALSAVAGTAAAAPVFPAIPASSVLLGAVYVPAGDTAIEANQIVDKRVLLYEHRLPAGANKETLRRDATGWVSSSLLQNDGVGIGIGTSPVLKLDVAGQFGASEIGYPTSLDSGLGGRFYAVHGSGDWGFVLARAKADTGFANLALYHTRGATADVKSALVSGDGLGRLSFQGAVNSTTVLRGAEIWTVVSGTPSGTALPTDIVFYTSSTGAVAARGRISAAGNFVVGDAGLGTGATDGFLYIPSSAGPPTGVPTAYTDRVPLHYDRTNNRFYVYSSGWKSVALA